MRALSLCSGIGGFDLAAEWASMEIVGQVEIDAFCLKVLAKHWPHVKRIPNLFDVRGNEFGTVDIILAGIPCQPYSIAGKRRGDKDPRALWPEVLRIIKAVRPTWVVIENVAHFVAMALDAVCTDLEGEGYACRPFLIPACGVGAWHKRERVFLVAYRTGAGREARRSDRMGNESDGCRRLAAHSLVATTTDAARRQSDFGERGIMEASPTGRQSCNAAACTCGQDASHSDAKRRRTEQQQPGSHRERTRNQPCGCDQVASNADRTGRQEQQRFVSGGEFLTSSECGDWWEAESRFCQIPDGLSSGMVRNRVAQLRAYGNAIVPQVAFPILQAIATL